MLNFPQTTSLLLVLSAFLHVLLPSPCDAWMRGVYGVDSPSPELQANNVDAVFISPSADLIAEHRRQGRTVYLTLNAFGGSAGWKEFTDARPIKANGEPLEAALGGICPTHQGWRQSRLDLLSSWLRSCTGEAAIDGIWLDFIRYPGHWEHAHPAIPDTCYCPRCLEKFQQDTKLHIPAQLTGTADKAAWINNSALLPWVAWKKEQIVSFAREARQVVDREGQGRHLLLGAFLVPWRKSDQGGAISFHLAQDVSLLAPLVDVFSPMVYHRMVGHDPAWIGEVSEHFASMSNRDVWPIIQAEDLGGDEFGQAVQAVAQSPARGVLVYKHKSMTEEHWPQLARYSGSDNLLRNPELLPAPEDEGPHAAAEGRTLPRDWFPALARDVRDASFWYRQEAGGNVIGLTAGYDRQATWRSRLPDCQPGASYLFTAEFFRPDRSDSLAYPILSLWGRQHLLNTHRMTDRFQKLQALITCPENYRPEDRQILFSNNFPGNTFAMRHPSLVPATVRPAGEATPPSSAFFPIGIYGGKAANLEEIRQLGFNSAVLSLTSENVDACLALDMRCTLSVPRQAEQLLHTVDQLEGKLRQGRFIFYVNDEPEIHSFPAGEAEDIRRILKQRFPEAPTNMAIVRPQGIPFYARSADFFMLDQYPVPNMPMTWLSESMDEAAGYVGRGRLQSVIQAFGDERHAAGGWPRLPTLAEMRCLALLSVIHGSRGIYFYTYPSISASEAGRDDLRRLVGELNSIRPWLQVHNDPDPVTLGMTSANRLDPKGNPAVHCARKERHNTQMLLCVNTLATSTEAEIDIPASRQATWHDYYNGKPYMVAGGTLLARFEPYEAKVLLESR